MAYNEHLSDRIESILNQKHVHFEGKKMMGGIAFMVDGKMSVGVIKDNMMARVGPDAYEAALVRKGCREMDFTKRPMKGYVYVEPEGWDMDADLEYWIDLCLAFNPFAKASKKR